MRNVVTAFNDETKVYNGIIRKIQKACDGGILTVEVTDIDWGRYQKTYTTKGLYEHLELPNRPGCWIMIQQREDLPFTRDLTEGMMVEVGAFVTDHEQEFFQAQCWRLVKPEENREKVLVDLTEFEWATIVKIDGKIILATLDEGEEAGVHISFMRRDEHRMSPEFPEQWVQISQLAEPDFTEDLRIGQKVEVGYIDSDGVSSIWRVVHQI